MLSQKSVHTAALFGGAACLLALALMNGPGPDYAHQLQFTLLAGGILLLLWGSGAGSGGCWPKHSGLLVGILLLAAALRLWNLEHAIHFYVDEGNFVEGILRLRAESNVRLMSPFNYVAAFTWAYPYLQWASAEIVGSNLLALRVVSAAFGLLTIAAVYRLGRVLFDARVGLLAAFALAVFPPHIHFSRLGLNNIADPLFGVLALAFLAQGLRSNRWRDYALAGVMLGLTQYFYEGGRLLYPALALTWGLMAAWRWRARLTGLLVMGGIALLVALPVYYTLVAWDITLTTRLERRGFDAAYWRRVLLEPGGSALLTHLREHVLPPFLHYVALPDAGAFYYGGHTALILPPLVPVFLAGIIAALRRGFITGLLPVLWLALVALGSSLIRDSVWTSRYVAAFPTLALLLAVGLDAVWKWLEKIQRQGAKTQSVFRNPVLMRVAMFLILLGAGMFQIAYYFGPHLIAYQTQIRPHHDQQDIVFRLRDLPPETQVYWITDDPDLWLPLLVFLNRYWGLPDFAPELRHPDFVEGWEALDNLEPGVPRAFFVEQEDQRTQVYLRERFGFGEPLFSPFNVPREKQYVLFCSAGC